MAENGGVVNSLVRAMLRIVRLIAVTYVCLVVFVYFYQRRMQYLPDTAAPPLPGAKRLGRLEEFSVTTEDGVQLFGWYWAGERPVTLLIFHGNGGNREHRLYWLERLHHRLKTHLCIIDYRGYGGSGGSPTERGLYLDAEATLAWLETRGAPPAIYLGESLGTGVAVELARRTPPLGLILQSGFSSATDVAKCAYPFLPVDLLMKDRFENAPKMGDIECPILVIHGERDGIIPMKLGQKLFDAAREPKDWLVVPGAGHNDLVVVASEEYDDRLNAFIERCVE